MEDSLETRADPAVYHVYVENRLILEPSTLLGAYILLPCAVCKTLVYQKYASSKCRSYDYDGIIES